MENLVPIALFLMIAVIVIGILYFKNQREKMWNETARLAIEKGQPIPERPVNKFAIAPDNEAAYLRTQVRREVKIGLISLAAGIAISVHITMNQGWAIGSAGAIPGLIGLAFLLNAWITNRSLSKIPHSDASPPRQ
jgi:hypothetical protein